MWLHALGGGERYVSGSFIVKLNPDADELDYMVDVMLTYPKVDTVAKDSSAICLMQTDDAWGVGIYVSSSWLLEVEMSHLSIDTPQLDKSYSGLPTDISGATTKQDTASDISIYYLSPLVFTFLPRSELFSYFRQCRSRWYRFSSGRDYTSRKSQRYNLTGRHYW